MERTTKGIFDFLCLQMEKLDAKKINVEELKGHASSAKQLNNLLRFELDRSKFLQKFPKATVREIESDSANK